MIATLPWLLLALACPPGQPQVSSATPPGGQRGTEVEVVLRGAQLDRPLGLLGDTDGIEVQGLASDKADRCVLRLRLSPDCALGAHALRLRTATGLSNLLLLQVGDLPERVGKGDRQRVPLGCTLNGDLGDGAVDRYVVALPEGADLHCEIAALRLGFGAVDLALRLLAPDGAELLRADDSALGLKDPLLSCHAALAGDYTIEVAAAFADNQNRGPYRLSIGSFPRPLAALPCGGQPGEQLQIDLLGDGPPRSTTVTLPAAACGSWPCFPRVGDAVPPTPIWLRVGGPPNREVEPDRLGRAFVTFPGSVHGVLRTPGQSEHFWFHAGKGQELVFRVFARALRSRLDPVLIVRQADGRTLLVNDDQRGAGLDCGLTFKAPATGDYQLEVHDLLRQGSPAHVFRLEGDVPQKSMSLRLSVTRGEDPVLPIPRGGAIGGVLQLANFDAAAGLALVARDLPEGVTATFGAIERGANLLPMLLTAASDAPLQGAMIGFSATARTPPLERDPGYLQDLPLIKVRNDQALLSTALRALPVAVVDGAPFALELLPPPVPILRGAPLALTVRVHRQAGNKERIRVRALSTPPGISAGQCLLDGGQEETLLQLSASDSAALGNHPFAVVASIGSRGSRLQLASSFVTLSVDKPWLSLRSAGARTEQGKPIALPVDIAVARAPSVPYQLQLLGLPRGVEADALTLPPDATTATFALRIATDAAPGRHRGLVLQASIPDAAATVLCRGRVGELRIDKPLATTGNTAEGNL